MSRDLNITMTKFLNCLDLKEVDKGSYQGYSPDFGWKRIFGGQLIAQSLVACARSVHVDRHIHSLHAYFIRPGDPAKSVEFEVEHLRDGASFSVRSVRALQNGHLIFSMQASFHRLEKGFEHQDKMPDVPEPENIDLIETINGDSEALLSFQSYMKRERPFELRPISIDRYLSGRKLEPRHAVWLRLIQPLPDNLPSSIHAAVLSYLSDMLLIDTALFPHGTNIFDHSLQGASLDHAMWFHSPFSFDDWMLYDMDSQAASGARGSAQGRLFKRDGSLIASVAQEGLIRKRAKA